jgi:mannose-6-phosphate isomerase-like protein (cupin superfamily)
VDLINVHSVPLYSDSLSSTFLLFIKKEAKLHKHLAHTEHVQVLDGEAEMTLGPKHFSIRKGDLITIPMGISHAVHVTSETLLKVISVQSPRFDGSDRILLE